MTSRVAVRTLTESEYPAWGKLVAGSPDGSIYASPEYLDALCSAAGGGYRVLGVFRGEELVGGLPLYEREGRAGRYVGPRLLLYYLGPVLRDFDSKYPSQRTARQIEALGALADALGGAGYDHVTLKCRHTIEDVRPFLVRGWRAWPSYSYVLRIGDLAAAWGRVEQNLRRLVDRCASQGITFAEDEDFTSFYDLHRRTLDRKDAPAYLPEAAFRGLFARLHAAGLCRLYQARLSDGQAIAAQLVLTGAHSLSHTVCAAADPAHLGTGVNAFLRWRSLEALSALGYTGNDLTDAALNPVTHFKSQFGGDLVTCFVLEPPASLRWRAVSGAMDALISSRGLAASAARRVLRRPSCAP